MKNDIDQAIADCEYILAKYRFIQERFPGASVHQSVVPVVFSSKLVNSKYTKFNIHNVYSTLSVEPYLEEEFNFNGTTEIVQIFCSPRRNRLAQIVYPRDPLSPKSRNYRGKRIIKFTKFKVKLADKNMSDNCWNDCRSAIMKFIKTNHGCDLDIKNLDPSLKKLMAFN